MEGERQREKSMDVDKGDREGRGWMKTSGEKEKTELDEGV